MIKKMMMQKRYFKYTRHTIYKLFWGLFELEGGYASSIAHADVADRC